MPGNWNPEMSEIPDRDLVSAIRVADLAISDFDPGSPHQMAWLAARDHCVHLLRFQFLHRPPPTPKDVSALRRILKHASRHLHSHIQFLESDIDRVEKKHDRLGRVLDQLVAAEVSPTVQVETLRRMRAELRGKKVKKPQRGRRFSEHQLRILGAIMFLHECGLSKTSAYDVVASHLYNYGKEIEADSLRTLEQRYRNACKPRHMRELPALRNLREPGFDPEEIVGTGGRADTSIVPENLAGLWLEQLGWFLLSPQVRVNPPPFLIPLIASNLKETWKELESSFDTQFGPSIG
jgi:hypothetical protein